jgi:hypothetical protein
VCLSKPDFQNLTLKTSFSKPDFKNLMFRTAPSKHIF